MTQKNEMYIALAKAQGEMGKALKATDNPFFNSKYADLATVMAACMPALHENGFAVIQPSGLDESGPFVDTVLLHESGGRIESRVYLVVNKNDMQGIGSAQTYARRYGLMGLAGIAPEDDDGNAASKAPPKQTWAQTVVQDMPPNSTPREKSEKVAKALCDFWRRKKSVGQLENAWDARKNDKTLPAIEKHDDLWAQVVDAYENHMMALQEKQND